MFKKICFVWNNYWSKRVAWLLDGIIFFRLLSSISTRNRWNCFVFSLLDRLTDFSCRMENRYCTRIVLIIHALRLIRGENCSYLFTGISNLNYKVSKVTYSLLSRRCMCSSGYTGQNCESDYIPCDPSPCENGGSCHQLGELGYACHCPEGE